MPLSLFFVVKPKTSARHPTLTLFDSADTVSLSPLLILEGVHIYTNLIGLQILRLSITIITPHHHIPQTLSTQSAHITTLEKMSLKLGLHHSKGEGPNRFGIQADSWANAIGIFLIIIPLVGLAIHDLSHSATRAEVACTIGVFFVPTMWAALAIFINALTAHRKPKDSELAKQIRDAFDNSEKIETVAGESQLYRQIREAFDETDTESDEESEAPLETFSPLPEKVEFHTNEVRERRPLYVTVVKNKRRSVVDGEGI